ncbi:MAG: hypothetical protein ABIA63_13165, partial [bacterium]
FSETPEIPHAWHWGLQSTDILYNELYCSIKNWLGLEISGFALPVKNIPQIEKDKFSAFTIKSPCLSLKINQDNDYKIAGGLKIYSAEFLAYGEEQTGGIRDTVMNIQDGSVVLFAAQSFTFARHYFNLFSSVSFRDLGAEDDKNTVTTFFIIPGYRLSFNRRWSLLFEYLITNMMFMPINPFFENWEQDWVSYMFYGVRYTRKHFVLGLMAASHYTFSPPLPLLPLLSVGFKF